MPLHCEQQGYVERCIYFVCLVSVDDVIEAGVDAVEHVDHFEGRGRGAECGETDDVTVAPLLS